MSAGLGRREGGQVGSDGSCAAPAATIKQQVDAVELRLFMSDNRRGSAWKKERNKERKKER